MNGFMETAFKPSQYINSFLSLEDIYRFK